MRYIKLFEEQDNGFYTPIDVDLTISRLPVGSRDGGKIFFRFLISGSTSKYSLMAGVAKLLDTKYENDPNVRNIEIDKLNRNLKIKVITKIAIFGLFLRQNGHSGDEAAKMIPVISKSFSLNYMKYDTNTIGELIDKMKKFRTMFQEKAEDIYDDWKTEIEMKKYNL